jgi:catechol 1,2-dioxygenase
MIYTRRRALVISAGALALACKRDEGPAPQTSATGAPPPPPATANPAPYGLPPTRVAAGADPSPDGCRVTHDNIEGPYYRRGAPSRWDITDPGMAGTPLDLTGRVTALDCQTPIHGATIEVWQANAAGHYDNDGSFGDPGKRFMLRGVLACDADGRYHIRTIVPGRYLNGPQYRPAHVHIKLRADGFAPLTTQLYFPDDPYNAVDPFIHPSLVMAVKPSAGKALDARYDFVLASA